MTPKNQVYGPKKMTAAAPSSQCIDVAEEDGRITPTSAHISRADVVRKKFVELGLSKADVADAITWARAE